MVDAFRGHVCDLCMWIQNLLVIWSVLHRERRPVFTWEEGEISAHVCAIIMFYGSSCMPVWNQLRTEQGLTAAGKPSAVPLAEQEYHVML